MKPVTIISGAAGGMGISVTKKFIAEGHCVIALTQEGIPEQEQQLLEICGYPDSLLTLPMNLLSESSVKACTARIGADHKSVDNVVMIVGGYAGGALEETDESQIDKMVNLNFKSCFFLAKHCFELMKKAKSGHMVFIGSKVSVEINEAFPHLAYSLSKGMVMNFAEILNEYGKPYNVRCSAVIPSVIDTKANRKSMPEADYSQWVTPEQIADVIYFACSKQADILDMSVYKTYGGVR